jgi:hypothetical protein
VKKCWFLRYISLRANCIKSFDSGDHAQAYRLRNISISGSSLLTNGGFVFSPVRPHFTTPDTGHHSEDRKLKDKCGTFVRSISFGMIDKRAYILDELIGGETNCKNTSRDSMDCIHGSIVYQRCSLIIGKMPWRCPENTLCNLS